MARPVESEEQGGLTPEILMSLRIGDKIQVPCPFQGPDVTLVLDAIEHGKFSFSSKWLGIDVGTWVARVVHVSVDWVVI